MTEIRPGCSKCSLTVVTLVVCTFFVGSGARANGVNSGAFASASAYAGAGASALSSAGAFGGAEDLSRVYDGHKGIRSYDNIGVSHDNNADRGAKSYGVIPGRGGDGIKGSDHGYNKNDCSKCKWENDDYWERDEPEEEGDENDGDDCDDGQYKSEGTRHRAGGAGGPDRGRKPGSRPPGVHKTGPTDVYVDDGPKGDRPAGPFGGVDYSVPTTGYAAPTGGFAIGSTPKPGSDWNTPFAYTTLKPGYAGATAGAYGTPSSSWPDWNGGTTPGGFASSSKPPTWGSSGPAGNFVTTPKPGASWNAGSGAPTAGGQPSSRRPWNIGHDGASISRPGQGWTPPFDDTPTADFSQKPAPGAWSTGRGPTGSFDVTPKPGPNWNTGLDSTSAGGHPFSRKPDGTPWSTGRASFSTTPKPGQSWNAPSGGKPEPSWNPDYGTSAGTSGCPRPDSSCTQGKQGPVKLGATPVNIDRTKGGESPSGISSAVPQTGSGIYSPDSYGSPKENQNWPYRQPGTQSTSAYAGASVTSGIGSTPYGGAPNFGKKDHPFFNKPAGTQTPYNGIDQAHPNTSGGTYGPESVSDYNKPGRESTWPPYVANTFGTTKRPYGGISTGVQDNTFSPRKLPGSPTGSGAYDYPGITKPSYGSGIAGSWSSTGQPASGSSTWHSPGTTGSYAGFPVSTTGFGTTKSPFGHTNIPGPASLGSSYSGTGLKQPGFNAASSSASASAGASAFAGTYSTPYIAGTTPTYDGAPGYPGVKSSPGSTGPTYGNAPHGTYPDAGTGAWPGKQPGSGSKTWPGEQPGIGGGITSGRQPGRESETSSDNRPWPGKQPGSGTTLGEHPGTVSDTWPGNQPGGNRGPWPSKKPGDGSSTWPGEQPGSISATWPTRQPGSGTGSWPGEKPGDGSGAMPGGHPGTVSDTWPGNQPGGNRGPWPSKKPGDGSSTWPGEQPGSVSATWPTRQPGSGTGSWPSGKPGDGSGATPGGHPGTISDTWPGKQPGGSNQPWPSAKPGDGNKVTPGEYPGTVSGTWPGRQPGSVSGVWPTGQPGSGSGGWPNEKPGDGSSATSGSYPGIESGIGPNRQPPGGSGAWPSKQPEDGSGTRPGISGCSSVNCGDTVPYGGSSNCGGGNYNCKGSCTGRDNNNAPVTYGPCDETISGPSGVNKTYYPAGTGDGNVPNIGNIYGAASSPFNNGIGAYPGTNIGCRSGDISCNQGASVTPEDPVQWNSANPFLFGPGGGTPSDVSRPWNSGITAKPIGQGNPFLDSSWSTPKPEYSSSNANNDRNVIPHGEGNARPGIGQGNPFLDDSKRRGDVEVNPNEGVIPLGGRKPEGYNPFLGSGNSGSDGPSYTGGQPGGYPALGTPESGGVKGGPHRGGVSPQQENSGGVYPAGGNPRGVDPLRCKLGIFGCGTPGSGSYEATNSGKHPGDVLGGIGGGVGTGGGNSGNVGSVPGGPGDPGTGISRSQFGAGHPASAGSNLAGSLAGAYAGSYSNAQASSFANARSLPFSDTAGSGNDFGQARSGSWSPGGAQNQGRSNSWASSNAFASSNSGSWSGNYPTDVKG